MKKYAEMSKEELAAEKTAVKSAYDAFQKKGLKLDMQRGKPGVDQLAMSAAALAPFDVTKDYLADGKIDVRSYGNPDGLSEIKKLFSEILECEPEEVIAGGNSSLNLMFDAVSQGMTHGWGDKPWAAQGEIKFLCPSPGYDRHFSVTEYFGVRMIPVAMTATGPDMDEVERLVQDPAVKGIWCVPKYSNPEGITYSDDTVRRFARLKPAAPDFRIFWDNAYAVHHLYEEGDKLLPLLAACKKAGNPDLALMFASTSKVTLPGAGVAVIASSRANIARLMGRITMQSITPDKVNQLRHARAFPDLQAVNAHMRRHAEILRPKFAAVLTALDELEQRGVASFAKPRGGYFISVDVPDGCAKRVVELCKAGGVALTPAGASFPYGKDPRDRNIRIAPTFPPIGELTSAMEMFVICVKLAALEKIEN